MRATRKAPARLLGSPPTTWEALPLKRPTGNSLYAGPRRLFVRGFDTEYGRYVDIDDEDRYFLDDSHVNRDENYPLRHGDLLMLNGQFHGDDETSVCPPGRVIAVGESGSATHDRVWCLLDSALISSAFGADKFAILRSQLPAEDRRLLGDLALDGRPATPREASRLMWLFGLAPTP